VRSRPTAAGWRALAILLPALASQPGDAARADEAVAGFWDWFGHEHEALLAPETAADRREALAYWLSRVDPGLSYVLETKGRRNTLIVSADGNFGLFGTAQGLVESAPRVKGWKFVALRPRRKTLTPERVDAVVLDPATTHFDLYRDGGRVGVVFYVPEYDPERQSAYRLAAMRLMCQAVGEWEVGTDVGFVDFDSQQVRDMQFSRPFSEFAGVFGKLRD
jgi:hypothetical protein